MKNYIIILLFIFSLNTSVFAEDTTEIIIPDTEDTLKIEDISKIIKAPMSKSPSGAIWRSIAMPGWGQYYVESYWKAPIFFGGAVTMAYIIVWNNNNFVDYSDRVRKLEKENEEPSIINPELQILKQNREFYRDQRDRAGFYLLGIYIIAAVDAYVGAHLFDFSVDDNLSLRLLPNYDGSIMLGLSYSIR